MNLTIMMTSAGRRVSMVKIFQNCIKEIGSGRVICTDAGDTAPACFLADKWYKVPKANSPDYISSLLYICKKEKISAIVPFIDTELMVLSQSIQQFMDQGVELIISGPETIAICEDKVKTSEFFMKNKLSHADIIDPNKIDTFPVFFKPVHGSASKNNYKIANKTDLQYVLSKDIKGIFQKYIEGVEYTIDVWVDPVGIVRSAIARKRLEVRGGEVSKGITERNIAVLDLALKISEKLPNPRGCITIQIFQTDNGVVANEVNPRFGGGFPLSWQAGALFPMWLMKEIQGKHVKYHNDWIDKHVMLRFDEGVFLSEDEIRINTIDLTDQSFSDSSV